MRRAARTDANQAEIVAALRGVGASVQPLHAVGQGCPDLLVGKDNVQTALSLVCFDDELEEAMKYIFGGAFVCKNGRMASKVTFYPKIRTKSVTLDGDVFDPAGTLTGGSRKNSGSILDKFSECSRLRAAGN